MVQVIFTSFFLLLTLSLGVSGRQCGRKVGGAVCDGGGEGGHISRIIPRERFECSTKYKDGKECGKQAGAAPCDGGLSQRDGSGEGDITSILSKQTFEEMLQHRDNYRCDSDDFYAYDAFVSAANAFPDFVNKGDNETRQREISAFFGQTSHETDGARSNAVDPYYWGYCHIKEDTTQDYCQESTTYPYTAGKKYYGRGPIQLKWNYNYGRCGDNIGEDLLNNPDLLETDPIISFKSAIWFWMTENSTKPSCHKVIIGRVPPTDDEGRKAGYGLTTNIINGTNECGKGEPNTYFENRIGFFKRYCDIFGIEYGDNLDCYDQQPYKNEPADLIENPDLLETDAVISFKSAIWFWMTENSTKPSCHNVTIGRWSPSKDDEKAGRKAGYGLTTNIINGTNECGKGEPNTYVENRIGFFKRYCDIFGIEYGDNLDCYDQQPYVDEAVDLVNSM